MAYSVKKKKRSLDPLIKDNVYSVKNESLATMEDWVFEAVLMGVSPMESDPVMKFIEILESEFETVRVYREGWASLEKGRFNGLSLLEIEFSERKEAKEYAEKLNGGLPS